jgi:hypothetical protein
VKNIAMANAAMAMPAEMANPICDSVELRQHE